MIIGSVNKNGQSATIFNKKLMKRFQPFANESTNLLPKPILDVMVFLGFYLVKVKSNVL